MKNIWIDGMYGLVVADALGVPVEFLSREIRKVDPVTNMRAYGTHNQPSGTWSDDSTMALATLASIKEKGKLDYDDIMERFSAWYLYGEYTPFGKIFDIGMITAQAISRYETGIKATEAGGNRENDNGNGSLMRILPACLFLYEKQQKENLSDTEIISVVHEMSSLTHRHLRSLIACGFYYYLVKAIIEKEGSLIERLQFGIGNAYKFYLKDLTNFSELDYYNRLIDLKEFKNVPEDDIMSSPYVVDTLEAAVWCLINSSSYKEATLLAVNLGDDTDTVGAVTGGLAGLFYGYKDIPKEWVNTIQRKDWIDSLLVK